MPDYGESYDGDGHGVKKSDEGSFASVVGGSFGDVVGKSAHILVRDINDEFLTRESGVRTHVNKAFYDGQSSDPGMYKLSSPIVEVFHLDNVDELKKYNDLLARTVSMTGGDPQIHILQHERQFWQGEFVVYVMYAKYMYLLPGQS